MDPVLNLKFDLTYEDLYNLPGLQRLHAHFQGPETLLPRAKALEGFLASLFGIEDALKDLQQRYLKESVLFRCQRDFIQRRVALLGREAAVPPQKFLEDEHLYATQVLHGLSNPEEHATDLKEAAGYAAWALFTDEGRRHHQGSVLFHLRQPLSYADFLEPPPAPHFREGFDLTDPGRGLAYAMDQVGYCLKCHPRGKDSCRTGLKTPDGTYQTNPLGVQLKGCPLDQKISEMMVLLQEGNPLSALAVVLLDNPLAILTGHRICNDCSKSCVFQRQEQVDVPMVETQLVQDILNLPWGFEIYSLLTRWNPLNIQAPLPSPPTGYKILVAGLGPAGIAFSHYMLNLGHDVLAVEGMKIEPLLEAPKPIYRLPREPLSQRKNQGFGGVAEYGITVRWDKNFLLPARLLLERRRGFEVLDGVRMGSTLTTAQAFDLGIDHIALALGAGKPHVPVLPGGLPKGVRAASDFLMALHVSGIARKGATTPYIVKMPIVVVGGGLTAVDAATEALAYYAEQVQHFPGDVAEFKIHGQILREAQTPQARRALLTAWGGATLVYRKKIQAAPSYRLNPEELRQALAEGVMIQENAEIEDFEVDAEGWVDGLRLKDGRILAAKTILFATGTSANTMIAEEDPLYLKAENAFLRADPADPFIVGCHGDGRRITVLGDLHPDYTGSVVKALASAKALSKKVAALLPTAPSPKKSLVSGAVIEKMEVGDTTITLTIRAPLALQNFKSGQFYKIQNYDAQGGFPCPMRGIAVSVGKILEQGTCAEVMVGKRGKASSLVQHFKVGNKVFFMGPSGSAFLSKPGEKLLLDPLPWGQHFEAPGCEVDFWEGEALPDFGVYDRIVLANVHHARYMQQKADAKTLAKTYYILHAPMQCMMKGICAQCIALVGGKIVYTCAQQIYPLQDVDLEQEAARFF